MTTDLYGSIYGFFRRHAATSTSLPQPLANGPSNLLGCNRTIPLEIQVSSIALTVSSIDPQCRRPKRCYPSCGRSHLSLLQAHSPGSSEPGRSNTHRSSHINTSPGSFWVLLSSPARFTESIQINIDDTRCSERLQYFLTASINIFLCAYPVIE